MMTIDSGADSDSIDEIPSKIRSWLDYLAVSDWFEGVVQTWWSLEDSHDIPPSLVSTSLEMGRWVASQTPYPPEPLFELARSIAAKDPLGHFRIFSVSIDEVERIRWRWWFYSELVNEIAIAEAPIALPEDSGPADVYTWRWQGQTVVVSTDARMKSSSWNLAKCLWQKWGRRVPFSNLSRIGGLFDEMIEDATISRHGSNATKWFKENGIPLRVTTADKHIWIERLE